MKNVWNWYWNTATLKMKLAILAIPVVIALIIYVGIKSRQARNEEIKQREIQSNIDRGLGANDVLTNIQKNIQIEVNNAANNSNQALENFNRSVNRDSSEFENEGARKRFCIRFPQDSLCRERK